MKPKEEFIPAESKDTVRHAIISLLKGQTISAKEISQEVRISEKEVFGHLVHIQKTLNKSGHHLIITPSACKKCGFVFKKRERLKKPGKCPVCRGESISVPVFSIKE